MIAIPSKIKDRLSRGLIKFQPVLAKAKEAGVNESDTITIITDILSNVFGYDKYENITSESAIKKSHCELAIITEDKIRFFVECKSAKTELKDDYARQTINYAAETDVEWVVLTNGIHWKVFRVIAQKPAEKDMVCEFNFCELDSKELLDVELLYYLCIEAFSKNSKGNLNDLYAQKKALYNYNIGQILLTTPVINVVKKELKQLYPETRLTNEELTAIISDELLRSDIKKR